MKKILQSFRVFFALAIYGALSFGMTGDSQSKEPNKIINLGCYPVDGIVRLGNNQVVSLSGHFFGKQELRVWEIGNDDNFVLLKTIDLGGRSASSPIKLDDYSVAVGLYKNIEIWNLSSGTCIKTIEEPQEIYSLIKLKTGEIAYSASNGYKSISRIKIADIKNNNKTELLAEDSESVFTTIVELDGENSNEQKIASGSANGEIKIWERSSAKCIKTLIGPKGRINTLEQLDANHIIAGESYFIWIFNIDSGEVVKKAYVGHGNILSIKKINDTSIVCGGPGCPVQIFDIGELENFEDDNKWPTLLCYFGAKCILIIDDCRIAAGDNVGNIFVWNLNIAGIKKKGY